MSSTGNADACATAVTHANVASTWCVLSSAARPVIFRTQPVAVSTSQHAARHSVA
ncbi:hypothetical protein ACRAKI_06670 [Saccharothrix isguenensis]